jgi:hypothetical protein
MDEFPSEKRRKRVEGKRHQQAFSLIPLEDATLSKLG